MNGALHSQTGAAAKEWVTLTSEWRAGRAIVAEGWREKAVPEEWIHDSADQQQPNNGDAD